MKKQILYAFLLSFIASLYQNITYASPRCPQTMKRLQQSLPVAINDQKYLRTLTNPRFNKKQLSQGFNKRQLFKRMGNPFKAKLIECQRGGFDAIQKKSDTPLPTEKRRRLIGGSKKKKDKCRAVKPRYRINLAQGQLVHLNPNRSFKFNRHKANHLTKKEADQITRDLLRDIGVPKEELANSDIRVLVASGRDTNNRTKPSKRRAEIHVHIGRVISKVPVFGSEAKVAINSDALPSRLHLSWPDFKLVKDIQTRRPRSIKTVVQKASKALAGKRQCNKYSKIQAVIAYAPVYFKDRRKRSIRYIPSVVIYATPPIPKENSGQIAQAGIQITVPLFE
ncbi:MAG: hypothetical protein KAH22_07700 [Thiotrichaceae bacterium]|nr:hypothetical protein [Thiotrichaceae bacterium]